MCIADYLVESGLDSSSHTGYGLQSRRTLPVDGMYRNGVRDACKKRGNAGLIGPLGAWSQDTADNDITNILLKEWVHVTECVRVYTLQADTPWDRPLSGPALP